MRFLLAFDLPSLILGVDDSARLGARPVSPGQASSSMRQPSPSPYSASASRDSLLQTRPATPGPYQFGSTVPDTLPEHLVTVTTEDPQNAVDAPISKLKSRSSRSESEEAGKPSFAMRCVLSSSSITGPLFQFHYKGEGLTEVGALKAKTTEDGADDDLKFWPTVLQLRPTIALVLLYVAVAVSIGMMWWSAGKARQFHVSSENVHMIARYFPSIIGTATVLLFRQTVREAIRMTPYVNMADQRGRPSPGAIPWKSVSGAFFPWQNITVTPGFLSFLSLVCQFMASFIVSLKVALLATVQSGTEWTLTVRTYPAIFLVAGYVMMAAYTLIVAIHFKGKSTGLKWDPVSIADYVALFAHCNALEYFESLELKHETSARDVMASAQRFRLGYWTVERDSGAAEPTETVYGIGVGWNANEGGPNSTPKKGNPPLPPWYRRCFRRNKYRPEPHALASCKRGQGGGCAYGKWPNCEHYPYRHNPGCARWLLVCSTLIVLGALVGAIYALARGWPMRAHGFTLANDWRIPSNVSLHFDNSTLPFAPLDPADPNSTFLVYALLFRSAPTYIAGIFTSTIIQSLDLNMRFMQPFRNMFGHSGLFGRSEETDMAKHSSPASDTVLLGYITLSPLQVPLTAYDRGHYKVSWFSTLNTISPLFPIFVGGLLTVSGDAKTVKFNFSLSAYIGILVSLTLYLISLPWAFPHPHRLLPRQFYSLADLMAMCHQSRWLSSPHLNIADSSRTPTKQHMEARILLNGDEFLFGRYIGRDGNQHLGFDVAKTREGDFGKAVSTGLVKWIKPEGWQWLLGQQTRKLRAATTFLIEAGRGTRYQQVPRTNEFIGRRNEFEEAHEMSGGINAGVGERNGASATGLEQPPQPEARGGGRGRAPGTVAFQGVPETP